jgi:hypothetical protein
MMPAILLEVLHHQSHSAGTTPLPPVGAPTEADESIPPLSERAVIVLTVLDSLSQIPLDLLNEWLPLTAGMVNDINDDEMREYCKHHFWQILVNGELDPERSRVCHAWWSTRGGKEVVLYGRVSQEDDQALMSGALPETFESKL